MRKGAQKRKESSGPGPEGGVAGGAGAQEKEKWEEIFTDEGNGKYSMEQWKSAYKFRHAYGNLSYDDPQPFMCMSTSIATNGGLCTHTHTRLSRLYGRFAFIP